MTDFQIYALVGVLWTLAALALGIRVGRKLRSCTKDEP
jgi:hypothetical protein